MLKNFEHQNFGVNHFDRPSSKEIQNVPRRRTSERTLRKKFKNKFKKKKWKHFSIVKIEFASKKIALHWNFSLVSSIHEQNQDRVLVEFCMCLQQSLFKSGVLKLF